jgi:hypothetical protein
VDNLGYLPNWLWTFALVAFVLLYLFSKPKTENRGQMAVPLVCLLLAGACFLWVWYPRDVLYPAKTVTPSAQREYGFYTYPMGEGVIIRDNGELYFHKEKSYRIFFSSRTRIESLRIVFGSNKGEYRATMSFFDTPLFEGTTAYERKEMTFSPQAFYPVRNLFLYQINLKLKKISSENMLLEPYFFQILPVRN